MKTIYAFAASLILGSGSLFAQQDSVFTAERASSFLKKDCYEVQRWQYPYGMSKSITLNILSDDTHCNGAAAEDRPEYQELEVYKQSATNPGILNMWNKLYEGVKRCNILINSETPVTAETKIIMAEAKFLRAMYYFDFVRFFGNIPINIDEAPFLLQVKKEEVYVEIEKDLLAAIPALPLKSEIANTDPDRATKGAAQTLLAKVYLYEEKWNDVITQLNSVIESNEYSLLPNFAELWIPVNQHCAESVYEIQFNDTANMDWNAHNSGNFDIQLMDPRIMKDTLIDSYFYYGGWGFCNITNDLYHFFKSNNDSVRMQSTILFRDSVDENPGMEFNSTEMYNYKYCGFRSGSHPMYFYNYSQNEYVFRYAEVLLMYAEAEYRLGNEAEAKAKLNMVRQRAKLPNVTATGENLLYAIQTERRLELALENNRFFDLVRWNIAEDVLGSLGYISCNNLLPIPSEILKEQKSFMQNPGYADELAADVQTGSFQTDATVWPNPIVNAANLKFTNTKSGNIIVSIYNIQGLLVKSFNLGNTTIGEVNYRMQLNDVSNGIYSLEISNGLSKTVNKIVVLK